jgi:hypothetical protein
MLAATEPGASPRVGFVRRNFYAERDNLVR